MALTRKQIVFLRSKAHTLSPVVSIGNAGLTEAVLSEIEIALAHHELIKVKLGIDDRRMRDDMCAEITRRSAADLVQQIGKIAVFYRPAATPRLTLP